MIKLKHCLLVALLIVVLVVFVGSSVASGAAKSNINIYEYTFDRSDANRDGVVDIGDITYIELMILELVPHSCTADANENGVVDMGDVITVENIIL